jgi:hypothetical protein
VRLPAGQSVSADTTICQEAITTYILGTQTKSNFLFLGINLKDAVFDFISPKEFITFEVLDSVIRGYKLAHPRLSNVPQILLGFIPRLGDADLE